MLIKNLNNFYYNICSIISSDFSLRQLTRSFQLPTNEKNGKVNSWIIRLAESFFLSSLVIWRMDASLIGGERTAAGWSLLFRRRSPELLSGRRLKTRFREAGVGRERGANSN